MATKLRSSRLNVLYGAVSPRYVLAFNDPSPSRLPVASPTERNASTPVSPSKGEGLGTSADHPLSGQSAQRVDGAYTRGSPPQELMRATPSSEVWPRRRQSGDGRSSTSWPSTRRCAR